MPRVCFVRLQEAVKDVVKVGGPGSDRAFISELTFPPFRYRGLSATRAGLLDGLNGALFLGTAKGSSRDSVCVSALFPRTPTWKPLPASPWK